MGTREEGRVHGNPLFLSLGKYLHPCLLIIGSLREINPRMIGFAICICTSTAALVPGLVWKACGAPHCASALVEADPVKETRQEIKEEGDVATIRMTQHAVCHADSHVTVVPGY